MKRIKWSFTVSPLMILTLLFTACETSNQITTELTAEITTAQVETSSAMDASIEAGETEAIEDLSVQPMEPQPITFTASDGKELQGYYYPASVDPAPLVVFMHWMMGNEGDWYELAVWLQNRGQTNPFPNPGDAGQFHWWDPGWFPTVPADKSYAVMIFSFRDCAPMNEGGCTTNDDKGRLLDAQAAMLKAYELEGIDQNKIVAVGSSIGADGAVIGCSYLNELHPGSCRGGLSLSPGNYLGVSYSETIQKLTLSSPPAAAWCLADQYEISVCNKAKPNGSSFYKVFEIREGNHGNYLLNPGLDPLPMQIILDFLGETLN